MAKPIIFIAGAIPVILAILIMVPLLTETEIPSSAINPNDTIHIEYTKHDLKVVSFGVTDKTAAESTEILVIKNDGTAQYNKITEDGGQSQIMSSVSDEKLQKLTALIKETGFMSIPKESFPIQEDVTDYTKSTIKITLNGDQSQIFWPNQDATDRLIPPIITMIESELEEIIKQIIE
ncbi:uncharacterized protein METZ01_LOCUS185176 [marine metagenome]|jgi:hypothetical protein|uniref:DUF4340 domain-containing protein n=1 Tax=marine metagenome TaxID=408172 RepID=A0A382D2T1_9ZZZZ|tara:strand:- start:73 stop:606 length:534 start_codon:yes stop_codon:yes gene_type:complete